MQQDRPGPDSSAEKHSEIGGTGFITRPSDFIDVRSKDGFYHTVGSPVIPASKTKNCPQRKTDFLLTKTKTK